jgi:hypothetical protein
MNNRAASVCLIALMMTGCSVFDLGAAEPHSIQATVIGTDQAVQQFLTGRELDPIEGAWKHDANVFEVVISKNNFEIASDYDYVGIITRTNQPDWVNGDLKILLRKTADPEVFDGVWIASLRVEKRMKFVFEHNNLVQASYVSTDGETYFVRINRMSPRLARTVQR